MTINSGPSQPEPPSAWALAQEMGDALPDPTLLDPERFGLIAAIRELVAAAVTTDATPQDLATLNARIALVTDELLESQRSSATLLGRHRDGRVENLTQSGSGRLNPQAPALIFDQVNPPHEGAEPVSVEVVGRCILTNAHLGPPGRAHGGIVATLLDETLGFATTMAGVSGMTAGITVRYRSSTPLHTPLTVTARYTHSEGRKRFATGEVRHGEVVAAEAEGIFIGS